MSSIQNSVKRQNKHRFKKIGNSSEKCQDVDVLTDITGLVRPNDGQKEDSDGDYDDKVIANYPIKTKTHTFVFTSEAKTIR